MMNFKLVEYYRCLLKALLAPPRIQAQTPYCQELSSPHESFENNPLSMGLDLRSFLPHDTFIMGPLLEGKWNKISGSDGSVKTDWRDDETKIL
jgi:hypothetical protein